MAKNSIPDFDVVDDSNTDIGGIGLSNSDSAGNLVKAIKKFMSIMKLTNNGATPLDDAFLVRNVTDTSKTAGLSAANVPVGTSRALDAEALYRNGSPIETYYVANATHTFALSTRYFQIEGQGGGGAGGGADGQGSGTSAAGGGGSSGFYGKSDIFAKGAILTGALVIGGGGTGISAATGNDGAATTWTDGTNVLSFGGGLGGAGVIAIGNGASGAGGGAASSSGAVHGSNEIGGYGFGLGVKAISGTGGNGPYGIGGAPVLVANNATVGNSASGRGTGGGGAAVVDNGANVAGGAGRGGILIVREW